MQPCATEPHGQLPSQAAVVLAQSTITHQRLPYLPRSDFSHSLEHSLPGHVSVNVQS